MSISLNQFAPNTPVAGMYVYMANLPQLHNCLVKSDVTIPLKSGDIVVIGGGDEGITTTNCPVVTNKIASYSVAVNSYQQLGVVTYNPVKNQFEAGERVSVARAGDVVWMPSAGAIEAGTIVQAEVDGSSNPCYTGRVVQDFVQDEPILGVALTPATAADQLIQVELKLWTSKESHT